MDIQPDLLTFNNGSPVDADAWPKRRAELADAIIAHEFGGMPPAHERVEVTRRSQSNARQWPGVRYHVYEVRVVFGQGREISLTLSLWIPTM